MTDLPNSSTTERRLAAIWFADIPGFTRLSAENEPEALKLLEVLQLHCRSIVPHHGGQLVKFLGDGALAEFGSTDPAVESALRLIHAIETETADWPSGPHRLRVGLHLGDVAVGPDGDIFGDGVNRASRLESLAEPGQLLVSDDVWRQLRRRPDLLLTDGGEHRMRNVPEAMHVYAVAPDAALRARLSEPVPAPVVQSPAPAPPVPPKSEGIDRTPSRRAVAVGMTTAVVAFFLLILWSAFQAPGTGPRLGAVRLAVTPFEVTGPADEGAAFLGDGIAEELIYAFSDVEGLLVTSRRSSFMYRDPTLRTADIGAKLGVELLVSGRLEVFGPDGLEIRAEVEDVGSMTRVADSRWRGSPSSTMDAQKSLASDLIAQLRDRYDLAPAAVPLAVVNDTFPAEALEALQRGRHAMDRGDWSAAVALLRSASEAAPTIPRIKLALAEAVMGLGDAEGARGVAVGAEARTLLEGALEFGNEAEIHSTLARVHARYGWDWTAAEREYRRALQLHPTAPLRREFADFLTSRGRFAEAQTQIATSLRDEPGSVQGARSRGMVFFRAGQLENARVLLDLALQLDPSDDEARVLLARAQAALGNVPAADSLLAGRGDAPMRLWRIQLSQGELASQLTNGDGERWLAGGGDLPYLVGLARLATGQPRSAMEALRRAVEVRSPSLMWLATDPAWNPIRGNERFDRLVGEIEGG